MWVWENPPVYCISCVTLFLFSAFCGPTFRFFDESQWLLASNRARSASRCLYWSITHNGGMLVTKWYMWYRIRYIEYLPCNYQLYTKPIQKHTICWDHRKWYQCLVHTNQLHDVLTFLTSRCNKMYQKRSQGLKIQAVLTHVSLIHSGHEKRFPEGWVRSGRWTWASTKSQQGKSCCNMLQLVVTAGNTTTMRSITGNHHDTGEEKMNHTNRTTTDAII